MESNNAVKITINYPDDMKVEVWHEGPHSAAGMVLDTLLGYNGSDLPVQTITVTPNPDDIPGMKRVG